MPFKKLTLLKPAMSGKSNFCVEMAIKKEKKVECKMLIKMRRYSKHWNLRLIYLRTKENFKLKMVKRIEASKYDFLECIR